MSPEEGRLREEVVDVARRCEAASLVVNAQGNLSARVAGSDHVLITPSGVPYAHLRPEDLVTVDLEGRPVQEGREPSSETAVHALAYRLHPGIGACVHVEPPHVNAVYAMNRSLPNLLGNFVYLFAGRGLALAPAMRSGSPEFAEAVMRALGDRFGVVWKNHGLFCVGPDLPSAFDRCVAAEQVATVYHLALALGEGEPEPIPEDVQAQMVELAERKGWTRAV